jgi:predicted lipid carrier protein YhbT
MMDASTGGDRNRMPILPSAVALGIRAIPLPVVCWPLQRMTRSLARRHPSLFTRLGDHAFSVFLIDPTDLPFAFRLWPRPHAPRIEVVRKPAGKPWDARIAGPLAALLGMVHGVLDGDALFFSRDLAVEGDTEAILALRNAIDAAEIDLFAEATAGFGPLGKIADRCASRVLPVAEQLTGVALSRAGGRSR